MSKVFLHFATIVALTFGFITFAQASHHEDMGGHDDHAMHDAMMDEEGPMKKLNLTDDQKKKIKEIRSANKDALKAKREAAKAAGQALHDAMKPETAKDEILAKFTAFQEKRNDAARSHMETMLAVREVLTPEQRKQWHETHAEKGSGKKGGHGHGKGRGRHK